MIGNLITATYSGDQTVRRVVRAPDGLSVASVTTLAQFTLPRAAHVAVLLAFECEPSRPPPGCISSSGCTGAQISTNAVKEAASGHAINRQFIHAIDAGFFFFIHTSTTKIYTLSLHDALPI